MIKSQGTIIGARLLGPGYHTKRTMIVRGCKGHFDDEEKDGKQRAADREENKDSCDSSGV